MSKSFKISLLASLLVIGLGVILFIAQPSGDNSGQEPNEHAGASEEQRALKALTPDTTFYDFGTISMKDGKVTKVFELINTSDSDVTIKKVSTSCMCTEAKLNLNGQEFGPFGMSGMSSGPTVNQTMRPGQSAEVSAIFDPNAHGPAGVGTISRTVMIEDSSGKMLNLDFKANVIP